LLEAKKNEEKSWPSSHKLDLMEEINLVWCVLIVKGRGMNLILALLCMDTQSGGETDHEVMGKVLVAEEDSQVLEGVGEEPRVRIVSMPLRPLQSVLL
jgi:hypothetical protein